MERHPLCRKIYLELAPPTEEDARGDRERILDGLTGEYTTAVMPLQVMRKLYPLCRKAGWKVTLLMGFHDGVWEILDIEAGDTTDQLYGLAVDYGSTTLVMQVVDLHTGEALTQQTAFNPQIPYGEEILSRIFYTKDQPEHLEELQQKTAEGFNALIRTCEEVTGIPKDQYGAMVIGGNTTMIHLLLGLRRRLHRSRSSLALYGQKSWGLSCRAMCMHFRRPRTILAGIS